MGKVDKALFVKHQLKDLIVVQIYVDDIIFGSTNNLLCDEFAKSMSQEFDDESNGRTFIYTLITKKTTRRMEFLSHKKSMHERVG